MLPVVVGVVLNEKFPGVVGKVRRPAPLMATLLTVLITAASVARNAAFVMEAGAVILAALFVLHGGGFLLGYFGGKVSGGVRCMVYGVQHRCMVYSIGLGFEG